MSCEVGGVRGGLDDVAEVDGVDGRRVDVGGRDGGFRRDDAEFGGGEGLEGAAEGSEGRSLRGDDEDIGHDEIIVKRFDMKK